MSPDLNSLLSSMPGDLRRTPRLSIVMPVLDEAATLAVRLDALADLRERGVEVVVVDGGSSDGTADVARARADRVLTAARGRATQMNAGAAAATGDLLVFLHADTTLPPRADILITEALVHHGWGRFDVRLDSRRMLLRIVGRVMNLRTRMTGIVTGDQTLFVRRALFDAVGGFPEIALMEDIGVSAILRTRERPTRIRERVLTSARRWEERGIIRTIVLMWRLRLEYFLGVAPERLAVRYGYRAQRRLR